MTRTHTSSKSRNWANHTFMPISRTINWIFLDPFRAEDAAVQTAPASFSNVGSSLLLACRSEFPPMCFCAMKMFGTVVWDEISSKALWIAAPSSRTGHGRVSTTSLHSRFGSKVRGSKFEPVEKCKDIPTWSSSTTWNWAPRSLRSCFEARQCGHQDLLNTAVK